MELIIISVLIFNIIVGVAAKSRGRNGFGWFLIACVISPVLALILVLVMKPVAAVNLQGGESKKGDLYGGVPDLQSGKYQLFLTKKYAIERNTTLDKFVIGDSLFPTLEAALKHADDIESNDRNERLRYACLIIKCRSGGNAFNCGISVGDILATYNGHPITSGQDIYDAMSKLTTPTASLVFYRDGKSMVSTISAGNMGIEYSVVKLDGNLYATRLKDFAIT
jgi:hypothetical protein